VLRVRPLSPSLRTLATRRQQRLTLGNAGSVDGEAMTPDGQNESDLAALEPASGVESGSKSTRESVPDPQSDGATSADLNGSAGAELGGSPGAKFSSWPDRLWAVAVSLCEWLARPRVRLTVAGVILLLVGGLLVTNSVWTLPVVIAGALMVAVAWIGGRLDGRLAVEWGQTGVQLEFRARIEAAQPARSELPQISPSSHYVTPTAEPEDAEVVEGEAHTVEIEVAALKALITAAETEASDIVQTDRSEQAKRNLRVAHRGGGSSDAAL
jgi:hypothetical protein